MHAPWVVHTTAVGQRRRNYDVTIARHRTLRSHAWRITFTGGSRHALTTPQYLDKTDSADRRRYSCDVIKTHTSDRGHLQRDFKSYFCGDYSRTHQRRAITRYASFVASKTKPTETLLMYFYFVYDVISAYSTCESSNSPTISFFTCSLLIMTGGI